MPLNLNIVTDRTVSVERGTPGADPSGAPDREPWRTLLRGLRAAVLPAADRVVASYGRRELQVDYTVFILEDLARRTALGGDLALNDRINDAGALYVVQGFRAYRHTLIRNIFKGGGVYEIHCLYVPTPPRGAGG